MGWWQEEDESYKDFKVIVKCTIVCVSLFVGLFLVEVGLRPQNAIWIFRAPRGTI
jgi:hypothetical protein